MFYIRLQYLSRVKIQTGNINSGEVVIVIYFISFALLNCFMTLYLGDFPKC